jgi:solute carrier family 13 (sodium-dependent dicarboxylate transporter), member 2/3/5
MTRQTTGLFVGLLLFGILLIMPVPAGLSTGAMRAGAVTLLMAAWWMSEAIPISATALIPLALFPLLKVLDAKTVAANYGHNYVLMLLAGFFIAKAIEEHGLHRRIALAIILRIGSSRRRLILSFMVATAFLSMWMANVAVAMLMLPIGLAVVAREESETKDRDAFGLALMLAIAYSASIGGTGTLIGTPPNMVFAGMVRNLYPLAPEISFFDWMLIGLPLVVIFVPITWLYLVTYHRIDGNFVGSDDVIAEEARALGPMSKAEKRVFIIFLLTALGWVFRSGFTFDQTAIPGWAALLGVQDMVHDATVAVVGALAMFLTPTGEGHKRLLDWKSAESVPWGVPSEEAMPSQMGSQKPVSPSGSARS